MFFEEGVSRYISCCKVNYDASYLILNKSSYTRAEWTGDIVSVVCGTIVNVQMNEHNNSFELFDPSCPLFPSMFYDLWNPRRRKVKSR